MAGFAGFVLRVALALSLAVLPWTQSWAMSLERASQSMPCHTTDHDPEANPTQPKAGTCCEAVHCHCVSAVVLPAVVVLSPGMNHGRWTIWTPEHPDNPDFAPTPPPPRA